MCQSLKASELAELEEFWEMEWGWGDYKQDFRIGQLCALLANIHMGKHSKKRGRGYTKEDFALRPKQTGDNRRDKKKQIMAGFDMLSKITKGKKNGQHRKPGK